MSQKWNSPIYVFFKKTPHIEYKDGRPSHVFECNASRCKAKNSWDVRWFLDKGDANSTSNLCKHAKICWGDEAVETVDVTKDLDAARGVLAKMKLHDGSTTAEFVRIGKGKITFLHHEHTKTEARHVSCNWLPELGWLIEFFEDRAEIVHWVSESKQPFSIVKDRGFIKLMKTGRPQYHLPSLPTVSRDVKNVFVCVHKCIAKMLQVWCHWFWAETRALTRNTQEHEAALSFAMDAWTLPNHKAYIAIMVHFENKGAPVSMLLDVVEVPCLHSGINLVMAFTNILDNFGIKAKVRDWLMLNMKSYSPDSSDPQCYMQQCNQ